MTPSGYAIQATREGRMFLLTSPLTNAPRVHSTRVDALSLMANLRYHDTTYKVVPYQPPTPQKPTTKPQRKLRSKDLLAAHDAQRIAAAVEFVVCNFLGRDPDTYRTQVIADRMQLWDNTRGFTTLQAAQAHRASLGPQARAAIYAVTAAGQTVFVE